MPVFVNGRFMPDTEAMLHVDDAGLQHAVGLFETCNARNGKVFRLGAHLHRLANSAVQLGLVRELDTASLAEAVDRTLVENKLTGPEGARVRITLTAGSMSLVRGDGPAQPNPSLVIQATPATMYDPAYFAKGITALIGPALCNPFDPTHGHKTLNYWSRLRALRQAAAAGSGEAICLQVTNHLAAGCISNVFLVKDSVLFTPIARGEEEDNALPAPVLPGITRDVILEIADAEHLEVHKQMLSVEDLLEADEVFLTNSSWHVLPVTAVEKHLVGDTAGPLTMKLRDAVLERFGEETEA